MNLPVVAWSFSPWRESPRRAAAGLAAALACAALPAFAGLPPLAAVALAVCGFAVFLDRLLPVTCRIDEDGVERRVGPLAERRHWTDLREARWAGGALWLSPFRGRHWLEAFRLLELPLPRAGREALASDLRDALERHGL